jgi:hypothetical protein
MNKVFDINADEVVQLTAKLGRLHRSAMPVAVRESLNTAAKDMKMRYIPRVFSKNFTERRPRFISSHTAYNKCANTFDINSMSSSAGVIKDKTESGNRLELQERGGTLNDRAVPVYNDGVSGTRKGERESAQQDAIYYFRKFKDKQRGIILKNKKKTIIKTDSRLYEIRAGGTWRTLYTLDSTAKIKPKRFIEPSGDMAHSRLPRNFKIQAEKQFKKYLK